MFDKILKTFADAVAAAVSREVAKQLPTIAEKVAGAVADRVLEKLGIAPLSADVQIGLHAAADLTEKVVEGAHKLLPSWFPSFLR